MLIWLTAEYTYLAVLLYYGRKLRESFSDPVEIREKLANKAKMWSRIAWCQLLLYYPCRLAYIIMQTKCYHKNFQNTKCLDLSHKVGDSSTIVTCTSITLFICIDLLLIWDTIRLKAVASDTLRNAFRFNYATVVMLLTMLLLQIVSVYMTMPWMSVAPKLYNVLDCIVCIEFLSLAVFFVDMSLIRKGNGQSIIIDELGNVIVIRFGRQSAESLISDSSNSSLDEDQQDPYTKRKDKVNALKKYLPKSSSGVSSHSDNSDEDLQI